MSGQRDDVARTMIEMHIAECSLKHEEVKHALEGLRRDVRSRWDWLHRTILYGALSIIIYLVTSDAPIAELVRGAG